jgi:polyisoprenoid-binding protein YceI
MALSADTIPGYTTGTWNLDPTHSEITFTVRHLAISKVRGTFRTWTATAVTTDDVEHPQITASVDMASIDTNQPDRDNHLRTGDFFAVEEHPQLTFVSTGLEHDGKDFLLHGDLTLRGVTKPVTIAGEFNGVITDPYGQTKSGASGTLTINRKDYGVNWNAALETGGFMLGDDVTITIEAQFVLQAAAE